MGAPDLASGPQLHDLIRQRFELLTHMLGHDIGDSGVHLMIDKFAANSKTALPFGAAVDDAEFEKFCVSPPAVCGNGNNQREFMARSTTPNVMLLALSITIVEIALRP